MGSAPDFEHLGVASDSNGSQRLVFNLEGIHTISGNSIMRLFSVREAFSLPGKCGVFCSDILPGKYGVNEQVYGKSISKHDVQIWQLKLRFLVVGKIKT